MFFFSLSHETSAHVEQIVLLVISVECIVKHPSFMFVLDLFVVTIVVLLTDFQETLL